jgi:hypothetical protein
MSTAALPAESHTRGIHVLRKAALRIFHISLFDKYFAASVKREVLRVLRLL